MFLLVFLYVWGIMIARPCNLYPLASQFYIVKLGFTRVYIVSNLCLKGVAAIVFIVLRHDDA